MSSTVNGHVSPFETISLEGRRIDDALVDLVPGEFARKNQILPLTDDGQKLTVALGSLDNFSAVQDLEVLLQRPIEPVLTDPNLLKEKIDEIYLEKILSQLSGGNDNETAIADGEDVTDLADLTKMAGETAVVQMINLIFAQAVKDGASDIHIEAYEKEVKVR